MFNRFANNHQKEINFIKDTSQDLNLRRSAAQDFMNTYLYVNGYKGEYPEVVLTDEPNSFARDSIDKKTGERRTEKIYLSIYDLNDPEKSFAKLFGHEKGHLATYDRDENTAEKIESKVSKEDKTRVFNSKEKDEYIKFLKENYKSKSLNEQFTEAKAIPKDERENYKVVLLKINATKGVYGLSGSIGPIYNKNPLTNEEEFGIVFGGRGLFGVDFNYEKFDMSDGKFLLNLDFDFESYEKENQPIKKFQGFKAGFEYKISAFWIGVGGGIDIDKNKGEFYHDEGIEDSGVKFMINAGYDYVYKIENPNKTVKQAIRDFVSNPEKTSENLKTMKIIYDLIKKYEGVKSGKNNK